MLTTIGIQHTFQINAEMIAAFNAAIGEVNNTSTKANGLIAATCVQNATNDAVAAAPHTYLSQSLKYKGNVFAGDTLHINTQIRERMSHQITLVAVVTNQYNDIILESEAVIRLHAAVDLFAGEQTA